MLQSILHSFFYPLLLILKEDSKPIPQQLFFCNTIELRRGLATNHFSFSINHLQSSHLSDLEMNSQETPNTRTFHIEKERMKNSYGNNHSQS